MCKRIVAATLSFVASCFSDASAAEVAIRAPVACSNAISCGYAPNLESVQKSFSALVSRRKEECSGPSPPNPELCKPFIADAEQGSSCGLSDQRSRTFLAPVASLQDGAASLRRILNAAKTGIPFGAGYQVVEADNSKPNEQHLALCEVNVVKGRATQPRVCATVAIIAPDSTWLRGRIGPDNQLSCDAVASVRVSGAIDIEFTVSQGPDPAALTDSITKMLDSDLDLAPIIRVDNGPSGELTVVRIKSAAPLRNSKILPAGWREAIDFDLIIYFRKDSAHIEGTAHASVSRTADVSLTQYVGLNDAQRSAYASGLDKRVLSAIRSACKSPKVIDAKTIACN